MAKSKKKMLNNPKIVSTKKLKTKKVKSKNNVNKKTLKTSHIAAVIYAWAIIPILLFASFIGTSVIMKIIDSILLAAIAVITILILKSYLKLSIKNPFTNNMSWVIILMTIIVGVINILRLYTPLDQTLNYVITFVTAAIYILFGISLFKMKKLSILFSVAAIFYVLIGAFNASLVLAIIVPGLYVAKGVAEAFLFVELMKKA